MTCPDRSSQTLITSPASSPSTCIVHLKAYTYASCLHLRHLQGYRESTASWVNNHVDNVEKEWVILYLDYKYLQSLQETYRGGSYCVMAKILHVQACSILNILCVAVSTEQHKVLERRVLLLILAWLHDRWQRCPNVPLSLPTTPHEANHANSTVYTEVGPETLREQHSLTTEKN